MATQQEIPIGDDELDALMAELETETAGMVVTPAPAAAAPVAAPAPVAEDDEMAALEAELNAAPAPTPAPAPVVTPVPKPAPAPVIEATDTDAEMAALEAELNGIGAEPAPVPVVAKTPEPKPAPTPAPDPAPAAAAPAPAPTLKVVPAPEPDAAPVVEPNPLPKPAPAALQFFIDVAQFRDDTKVAEHNLDNCMMQQAGHFATYAESHARAEAQHMRLKARFEVLEAQLYDQHRKALIAAGEKATEKQVENAVRQDPKWLKNRNVVIEAETIASINKGCVESLKQRRDMIIQLGADRREEGKGQVRIMAQEAAHADMKARAMRAAS